MDIADILDVSPVRFQVKKKKIGDLSTPTKSYLLKKFHEAATLLTLIRLGFLGVVFFWGVNLTPPFIFQEELI